MDSVKYQYKKNFGFSSIEKYYKFIIFSNNLLFVTFSIDTKVLNTFLLHFMLLIFMFFVWKMLCTFYNVLQRILAEKFMELCLTKKKLYLLRVLFCNFQNLIVDKIQQITCKLQSEGEIEI